MLYIKPVIVRVNGLVADVAGYSVCCCVVVGRIQKPRKVIAALPLLVIVPDRPTLLWVMALAGIAASVNAGRVTGTCTVPHVCAMAPLPAALTALILKVCVPADKLEKRREVFKPTFIQLP